MWEDEPSGESRFRRVQAGVLPIGRPLPGMPLDMPDPDEEAASRPRGDRFGQPASAWWRPASTVGRVLLGVGVLAVLGGVTAGALVLKTYLGRDSRFRITSTDNIEAVGLTQVSRDEMLPVFGEDIGRNIFFIPLNERRKQLEAIPWVEHATVMRLLPDQLRVSIVERQPVAFVRQGQQIGLVDKDGVLLTMPPAMMAQHHYSFPVVTGLDPADPPAMRKARMAVYERLISELDANNQNLSQQISEIDLTDPQDARVTIPEQGADLLAHFGDDRFLDRYQRYKSHIAEWRQQYPKLAAVDLRYENQVVLEMTPGTDAVAAAVDGSGGQAVPAAAPAQSGSATAANATSAAATPVPAKPAPTKAAPTKPATAPKPAVTAAKSEPKPSPKSKTRPEVKTASVSKHKPAKGKAAKKGPTPEELAAAQRKARERTAKERAAHEKVDKKHAAAQRTAQSTTRPRPSTHSAASAAQGQ